MTPDDMAALHATAFDGPARWSAQGFAALLETAGVFLADAPDAFLLGRAVAGEAELLTLVVAIPRRGHGVGRDLLARFDAEARSRGSTDAFLEVAEDNMPARALYARAGWCRAGHRPGYYAGSAALILRKSL